jgi:trehalose 6-phosphate phosphatase
MMRHLFRREGRAALSAALQGRPLLAFDFDGTLAPIVARPSEARVGVGVSERLARLAELRPVAIITGRSVEDVAPRLGFTPQFIVGNHGAEDPEAESRLETSALEAFRNRLGAQADDLARCGVSIEDKGYSVALHFRLAEDRALAQHCIETILRDLEPGLKFFGGKCIANVVVAGAPDKGDAVAALVARAQADGAIFVGDDINDEAVFERAGPNWLTIRIGRDDPMSHAAFFLDSHAEVATLLQSMLELLALSPRR